MNNKLVGQTPGHFLGPQNMPSIWSFSSVHHPSNLFLDEKRIPRTGAPGIEQAADLSKDQSNKRRIALKFFRCEKSEQSPLQKTFLENEWKEGKNVTRGRYEETGKL